MKDDAAERSCPELGKPCCPTNSIPTRLTRRNSDQNANPFNSVESVETNAGKPLHFLTAKALKESPK